MRASSCPNLIAALASIVVDDRWRHLRDGAFVVIEKEDLPAALCPRPWPGNAGYGRATAELFDRPTLAGT